MKAALLIEDNQAERVRLAKILQWIGFQAAPVRTPEQALNVVDSIKFSIIVTCTPRSENDRRALTGELKRLAPEARIVLLTYDAEEYRRARAGCYPGVNAVLRRPVTMDVFWRLVRFGTDEFGVCCNSARIDERRRRVS